LARNEEPKTKPKLKVKFPDEKVVSDKPEMRVRVELEKKIERQRKAGKRDKSD